MPTNLVWWTWKVRQVVKSMLILVFLAGCTLGLVAAAKMSKPLLRSLYTMINNIN